MSVKMPILLDGQSMNLKAVLRPANLQIQRKAEGLSTASLQLDADQPELKVDDWVQVWSPQGEMDVFYVKKVDTDYVTGLRTVSLEHGMGLLNDIVMFGEIKPSTMGGSSTACTCKQAMEYCLNQQSIWEYGGNDFETESQGWNFNNQTVLAALNTLPNSLSACQWEFDQSVLPWKLYLKAQPTTTTIEMRRSRNISTLKVSLDKNGMYTRIYPTGKNNMNIASVNNNVPYLEENTATWGVISKVVSDGSIKDKNQLLAYAQTQLHLNSTPIITVTVSGWDLSEATGEPLDHLVCGRKCRIPLPEYGVTVDERITELSWKNALMEPEAVTVTLANVRKTIQGVMAKTGGGGGGGGSKANTEHECELADHKEKIDEIDGSVLWAQRENVVAACGELEVHTDVQTGHKDLVVKNGTSMMVDRDGFRTQVVDQGNVLSAINQSGESVQIQASKIDLQGYVTADQLAANIADIDTVHVNAFQCDDDADFTSAVEFQDTVTCQDNLKVNGSLYVGNNQSVMTDLGYFVDCTADTSVTGQVSLTFTCGDGTKMGPVTFSRGGSASSVSLSAVYNVHETQEGSGNWVADTDATLNGSTATRTLDVNAAIIKGYQLGWAAARNACSVSYTGMDGGSTSHIMFSIPSYTVGSTEQYRDYKLESYSEADTVTQTSAVRYYVTTDSLIRISESTEGWSNKEIANSSHGNTVITN